MRNKEKIFILDDDELITSTLSRVLNQEGYEVQAETEEFQNIVDRIESWSPQVFLLDIKLPSGNGIDILKELNRRGLDLQVIMLTSDDTAESAVKCMKLGAADYLTKPFNIDEVKIVIRNTIEKGKLKDEVRYLRKIYQEIFQKELVGESAAIAGLKSKMEKIARARVPSILITGESGTGKELVARCLHRTMYEGGAAESSPFIAVNCTALPEPLLESELFGHEKGAFTDAKSEKKGIFELAHEGTILLDEIGDMKPNLQSKLLRVLEERTLRRIGGYKEIPIDVTVIATTNRNLSEMVERNEFRIDLFYRLNTFLLTVPPLRERREDISLLAKYFLSHFALKYNNKAVKSFAPETERALSAYDWPGNVRELKNCIERVVVLENSERVMPWHLPEEITSRGAALENGSGNKWVLPDSGLSLEELEKELIRQALEKTNHNKVLAAKSLNISYDSLRYQVKKFGLE